MIPALYRVLLVIIASKELDIATSIVVFFLMNLSFFLFLYFAKKVSYILDCNVVVLQYWVISCIILCTSHAVILQRTSHHSLLSTTHPQCCTLGIFFCILLPTRLKLGSKYVATSSLCACSACIVMCIIIMILCLFLQLTPAESRELNKECIVLGFYDNHDIWHFLSACAMFFTFLVSYVLLYDYSSQLLHYFSTVYARCG